MIVTVAERKRRAIEQRSRAGASVMAAAAGYARAHGGRFIIFGSFARGEVKLGSDIDVIVDFPPDAAGEARLFLETLCCDADLPLDCLMPGDVTAALQQRIDRDGVVLG